MQKHGRNCLVGGDLAEGKPLAESPCKVTNGWQAFHNSGALSRSECLTPSVLLRQWQA